MAARNYAQDSAEFVIPSSFLFSVEIQVFGLGSLNCVTLTTYPIYLELVAGTCFWE